MSLGERKKSFLFWLSIITTNIILSSLITYRAMKGDDVLGFIGAIIGILGAYLIYTLQKKQEYNEKRNYALQMLFYLLSSCVRETDAITKSIVNEYFINFRKVDNKQLEDRDGILKKLEYILKPEYFILEHLITKEDFKKFRLDLDELLANSCDFNNLVYDENWYNNIYYIKGIDRVCIIKWMLILKTGVNTSNLYEFLHYRELIIEVLSQLCKTNLVGFTEKKIKPMKIECSCEYYYENFYNLNIDFKKYKKQKAMTQ